MALVTHKKNCTIKNCLNADALTTGDGTYQFIHIGGITESGSQNDHVSNCVSTGRISEDADKMYIGSIVGQVSSVDLKHCYWSDSIKYDVYGKQSYSEVSECFRFNNAFELKGMAFENNYTGSSLINLLKCLF